MQAVDPRAERAARLWMGKPGNTHWRISTVFDRDDARQEAILALLTNPDASYLQCYSRVIDGVRKVVPGYRERNVVQTVSLDDCPELTVDCQAERMTLLRERAAIIDALPESQRQIIMHDMNGDSNAEVSAAHGVKEATWIARKMTLYRKLAKTGF